MQRRKKLLLAVWVVGYLSINTSTLLNLVAKPEIEKPEQLRGKNIGISRYGTSLHTGARIAMKHFGLEPGKDVAIVEIGSGDWIVGAL
jgi:ABC-type nitrate/sulfonate/bicarbonate transport system substrate-binding protein